jgi:hypothetical protein
MKGEHLVARMHAHPRLMGPKMDSLLYVILGSLLRNCFVSPLWTRQIEKEESTRPRVIDLNNFGRKTRILRNSDLDESTTV